MEKSELLLALVKKAIRVEHDGYQKSVEYPLRFQDHKRYAYHYRNHT